jgi:hypothetical protein
MRLDFFSIITAKPTGKVAAATSGVFTIPVTLNKTHVQDLHRYTRRLGKDIAPTAFMMQTEGKADRKNELGDVQKDILPTSKHSSQNQRAYSEEVHIACSNQQQSEMKCKTQFFG